MGRGFLIVVIEYNNSYKPYFLFFLMADKNCSECGILVACKRCSELHDLADEQMKRSEEPSCPIEVPYSGKAESPIYRTRILA